MHWSTGVLPGQGGVYGVGAYRHRGCWFFVTFGLTELYEKESDDAAVAGWGFEFTMRTPRADGDQQPPGWPHTLLAPLGEYVFTSGGPESSAMTAASLSRRGQSIPIEVLNAAGRPMGLSCRRDGGQSTPTNPTRDGHVRR